MPIPTPDHWQPLFARHKAALFLMARQYLASPQEAEDAMQEGFIKFWKSRDAARDPLACLFTCVRSAALDLRRARLTRVHHEHAAPLPSLFTTPVESADRHQQLEQAVALLSEDQREVLVLKIWSDLTFAQIAETLRIPLNTAASRYRYALTHLESLLTREFKNA